MALQRTAALPLTTTEHLFKIVEMSEPSEPLGYAIREARRRLRITLVDTAKTAGVSTGLLSLIEQGKHVPPRPVIARLAHVLDGDADEWCALIGRITPEAESWFAKLASEKPELYRNMLKWSSK